VKRAVKTSARKPRTSKRSRVEALDPGAPPPSILPATGPAGAIGIQIGAKHRVAVAIATVFGTGLVPYAQGTLASVWGVLAAFWFRDSSVALGIFILVTSAACVWSGTLAEERYAVDDPHPVVMDEVAGMALTLLFHDCSAFNLILGFFLFRLFDVWKPYPIRALQRLHGGWGILLDDLLAGVYASAVLYGLDYLI